MMQRAALDSDLRVAVRRYEQDLNVLRQRYHAGRPYAGGGRAAAQSPAKA